MNFFEEDFKHYNMNYIGSEPGTEEHKKYLDAFLAGACTCFSVLTNGKDENMRSAMKTISEYMRRRSRDANAIVAKLKLELESSGYDLRVIEKFSKRMLHPEIFMETFNSYLSKFRSNREAFMATLLALNLRSILEM